MLLAFHQGVRLDLQGSRQLADSLETRRGVLLLEGLIERSAVLLEREQHRLIHGSDFKRWGRRGGLATLRRYGTNWYSALARKRWGRLDAEELDRARLVGSAHFAELARRRRRRPVREG